MSKYHKLIGVKEGTKSRLDSLKLVYQESYDNLINRLIDSVNGETFEKPSNYVQ